MRCLFDIYCFSARRSKLFYEKSYKSSYILTKDRPSPDAALRRFLAQYTITAMTMISRTPITTPIVICVRKLPAEKPVSYREIDIYRVSCVCEYTVINLDEASSVLQTAEKYACKCFVSFYFILLKTTHSQQSQTITIYTEPDSNQSNNQSINRFISGTSPYQRWTERQERQKKLLKHY